MPKERDPIWKHVQRQENGKWKCSYCGIERGGGATRIWAHLAGFGGKGIKGCEKVDHQVRKQALQVIKGKRSTLDESTGGTSGEGTEGIVFGASQSVLPSDDVSNPNDTQNSNRPGCAPQQPSCCWSTGTGTASACPQDQVSLPPSDMPLDNLNNTQQSDPSNGRLDAAHGNENASSLQPLSSLYISEPPALPELSTHLEFGTGTPRACPQYEVSLPRKDKSTGGTSGKGTEGIDFGVSQSVLPSDDASNPNDTQNWNQLGCVPQQQSFYLLTGASTAPARPEDQGSLPPGNIFPDILDNTQQSNPSIRRLDAAHGKENALSLQQHLMDFLSSPSDDLLLGDGVTLDTWLYSPENLHDSPPENRLESHNVDVSTSEEIQTNELHNPTAGSSLQMDPSLDVDRANGLQDCVQPRVVEGVPARSNTSPNDTVQHPCQLPQRCDKEDGNDICRFPSQTPMVIDPSTALQHPTDSHIFEATNVHLLVPGTSTNPIGPSSSHGLVPPQRQIVPHRSINLQTAHQNPTVPSSAWENRLVTGHPQTLMDMDPCMPSSSQAPNNAPPPPQIVPCGTGLIGPSSLPELDMNEGAPMTSHLNTCNIFEESGALKRKLEQLFSKEAHIREELKFGASLSLKKPRMEVANWLVDVEKLRNDCLLSHQVDILMCEAEGLWRQGKGLFETRETKVNNLIEEKMVGKAFQRNTTEILQYLEGNKISQLGIYGMGGVGKTTIMVHIHNRLKKANYGNVLWITISQDFNTERLQDAIWKELGSGILQEKDVRKRAAILHDCLMKRGKSTIILDDVWERFDLKEVGIPIKADGIKLVLTTQSFKLCREMHCQEMIKIEPLSQIEAESLFFEELGPEVALDVESEAIVKSIVKECAGLPLAVITMARSMHGVTNVFEWEDYLEKLRESDMGQMEMEKKVLMKLKLSYDRLGNHEVQQCFLSCALYPEDYLIDKFELIEFFIDEGLIGPLSTRKKQYDRGLTILNKLVDVCLLENHWGWMKMHDLIRDMALNIMRATSIVKAQKGLRTIPSEEYWTDALEKVSLMENDIEEFPLNMSPNCPKLSTFLLNSSLFYDVVIPDSFFEHLRGLKVLNLSQCCARELPDSISDLVNLRALLLRNCLELRRIPYLGKLRSLRKLDIVFCEKVEVLEGLEKLADLRYLDVHGTKIKQLPKGTLGALLNLQYLKVTAMNGEDITKLKALDLETVSCSFKGVDEFNKFVRMVSEQRNKPLYYNIKVWPRGPNVSVDATYDAQLETCERHVSIYSWSPAILIPQNVRTLNVDNCDGVTNLSDMGLLENLEKLGIIKCKNLRVLSGRQDEEIINIHDSPIPTPAPLFFQSLRDLYIFKCQRLRYLFGHEPKFYLPHLRKITIIRCTEMVGITVAVTSTSPHPPPAFPSLENIYVWGCDKLKRVVESEWLPHFCNLRTIKVVCCENVEEIIGGPFPYMPVEEISLEKFSILDCNNLRKLFPQELLIHLCNLQSIKVKQCKGMVEMISGVGQGQEGSIMTSINNTPSSFQSSISLPKLISLHLYDLRQLKSICEVPITCNSMRRLGVLKCPELNKILLQLRIRDIEDLQYIRLRSEELTLTWDHTNAQAILQSHRDFGWAGYVLKDPSESESEIEDDFHKMTFRANVKMDGPKVKGKVKMDGGPKVKVRVIVKMDGTKVKVKVKMNVPPEVKVKVKMNGPKVKVKMNGPKVKVKVKMNGPRVKVKMNDPGVRVELKVKMSGPEVKLKVNEVRKNIQWYVHATSSVNLVHGAHKPMKYRDMSQVEPAEK